MPWARMKSAYTPVRLLWLSISILAAQVAFGELLINEILFNPPGTDAPNQTIELRGTPNLVLPAGTYLVTVEGDSSKNIGTLKNIFDLSGLRIGGNGFLVLLQKNNSYTADTNATVLVNTGSDPGWGSGSGSTLNHRGDGGQTDLQKAPVTFCLIQTANAPSFSTDIDNNDNGTPDGAAYASWTILDSIGVLGTSGYGYGAINFRKSSGASGTGTLVTLGFTADYIGRSGNTIGAGQADWVVSNNLGGAAPTWTLGSGTNTVPGTVSGSLLNHIGAPNFAAPAIPGVLLCESGGSTDVGESGGTDSYTLALNTIPSGNVLIQINAEPQLQVSTDGGSTFGNPRTVTLANTTPKVITVRAVDDNVVDTSLHPAFLHNSVSSSADPAQYPLSTIIPDVLVSITENDSLLLNELKVNPPGTNDTQYEYVEIKGNPSALLTNVYLLALEGNAGANPGTVNWVVNLTGTRLGSSGLLVIAATNCAYTFPAGVSFLPDPQLSALGGTLANGTVSFLLVSSPAPIPRDRDLDAGNNGILEGFTAGTTILDAVAWSDADANDVVYGSAVLAPIPGVLPDAVSRFPTNLNANSAAAWFYGELVGPNGDSLVYDPSAVSANYPVGAMLSPGVANNTDISLTALGPLSGVIGDPTNPDVLFQVSAAGTNPDSLVVTASSSNPDVVPDSNLIVTAGPNGQRRLHIVPTGVGYATIIITVRNGATIGATAFLYAASAMGRPNGRFHTGTSDASSGFAVDGNWMFVGDDQNQVIRLYHRNLSGPPVAGFDFLPYLDVGAQENGEVDIEASTHVGNRIYWIGSHSHNNLAQSRTNRTRIFATDLSGNSSNATLSFVGMYTFLKVDLLNWDSANGHGKGSNYYGFVASADLGVDPKANDGAGFNIEGLTMAPGSTTVGWLGFRAPLLPVTNRAKALILPILNFDTLAVSGGPPGSAIFGAPIELNLGCRGIRSMEAASSEVLIVAGPPGNGKPPAAPDFKLFTWSGIPADLPQEHTADLTGMNLEGIVEVPAPPWTANTQVELLSDSGNTVFYNDGIPAKHLTLPEFKKFRTDWVAFGDVVSVPQPCIKSIQLAAGKVALCWCSLPGLRYRIQYKPDLNAGTWTDASADFLATDATTCASFSIIPGQQIFFRIIAWR